MIQAFKQSMDEFMIQVPTQIFFGKTALDHLAEGVKQYGDRVMLVYGGGSIKRNGLYDKIVRILDENGIFHCELAGVEPNPRVSLIKRGIALGHENQVDLVLPIGGGSAIDTAKGIAGAYYHEGDFWELAGKNITSDKVLPVICVLTLPAAGSEMATGCTWVNDEVTPHIKSSFHGPYIRPRISYLDPTVTFTLSKRQTAAGVTDILSHIIESYFSNEKRAYLHARTAEGMMKTLLKYTPIALEKPDDYEARANIMYCSSWGNNGLIVKGNFVSWSVHLMENPINEYYDSTHGDGLAILTPHWLRWAMRPQNLYRYVDFGVNVFGIDPSLPDQEIADQAIQALEHFLFDVLGMPRRLRDLGVKEEDFPKFAEGFKTPGTIEYQSEAFVPMSAEDVIEIYKMAY